MTSHRSPFERAVIRTCGVLMIVGGAHLPHDRDGCIRPQGHDGAHLCNTDDGPHEWETDWDCDCEHCSQCEGDYCILYWPYNTPLTPDTKES